MQYWQTLLNNPSGEKSMDDFAMAIDKIPKVVFSNTLKTPNGIVRNLKLNLLKKKKIELKQQSGKDIFVGSWSLIIQLMKLNLIDELQICIQPVIAGNGLQLFENLNVRAELKLIKTKVFTGGAIILYYEPIHEKTVRQE